jgi:hypothetical protein
MICTIVYLFSTTRNKLISVDKKVDANTPKVDANGISVDFWTLIGSTLKVQL